MKRRWKVAAMVLALSMAVSACGNTGKPATKPNQSSSVESKSNNPLIEDRIKLLTFDYDDVTLQDGLFKQVYDGCMEYYDALTADDILYRWRKNSGMDTKSGRDLGWEAGTTNPECCIAQLISAKARRYAITKKEENLQIVKDILSGYQEIIDQTGTYPQMYSAYFYEKTLRAFIDCYECCELEQGYEMAKAFVSWGMANDPFKKPEKLLGDNGSEWYTMSEALYEFADLAKRKGENAAVIKQYTDFAKLYEYTEFWDIFYNEENLFDYKVQVERPFNEWFHAYSHLNSFNSALEAYKQTGKEYYLDATTKFYTWARETQKLATGGYGAQWEWLLPSDVLVGYLRTTERSTETQCNAYAVVNMDNRLTSYTADAFYGQWTEEAFYNMTIASLETRDGCPTYYSDYSSDGGTKYLRWDWPWACCAGTRPLVVMEYLKSIYFNDTRNLYVNLYTNAAVNFTNANGNEIELSQNSAFPEETSVTFNVNTSEKEAFSICFRKPEWLAGEAALTINGETAAYEEENNWYVVNREWKDGDTVVIDLPMNLYYSVVENGETAEDTVYAVKYGPVTLACDGAVANLRSYIPLAEDANTLLTRQETDMIFTAARNSGIVFKPYYSYEEGKPYTLYISTK